MQATNSVGYDQAFQFVRLLSPKEKERLFRETMYPNTSAKLSESIIPDEEYYEFLMNFPVVSEKEIEQILEAKKEVDKCCPVSP
jgi:hypothetical protein